MESTLRLEVFLVFLVLLISTSLIVVLGHRLLNKNTVEFLGVWEQIHNPKFKTLEFEGFLQQTGFD